MTIFLTVIFLLLYALEQTILTGIKSCNVGQVGKVNKIMKSRRQSVLPIFGSSVANFHFDPRIIDPIAGCQSYNFGLTATPLLHYKGLLKEYLPYTDSKYIIIAVTVDELSWNHPIYEINRYIPYFNSEHIVSTLCQFSPTQVWKLRHIPYYSFTTFDTNFYIHALKGLLHVLPSPEEVDKQGFTPIKAEWDVEEDFDSGDIVKEINLKNITTLKSLIKDINQAGKTVILVLPPVYEMHQRRIRNMSLIKSTFKLLAGEQNHFMDFTTSGICKHQDNFYDNLHLNEDGARYFSRDFALRFKNLVLQ